MKEYSIEIAYKTLYKEYSVKITYKIHYMKEYKYN